MDVIYAETIHSFANDLDNLWKDKTNSGLVKKSDDKLEKDLNCCSLNRFLLSAQSNCIIDGKPVPNPNVLSNVDRLAKTASIWTRPELSRIETENILQDYEKGIFLVRMTTDQKTIVLSYRAEEKVQHVMIKVDVIKGFYMDGSQNIFKNVNLMISHYMTHSLHGPNFYLKLPRALCEAYEPMHFKFFENLKLDFWKTSLANKSINEIWPNSPKSSKPVKNTIQLNSDANPPLPPRGYDSNDLSIIQGLADVTDTSCLIYNEIVKDKSKKNELPELREKDNTSETERVYSKIWNWTSDQDLLQENQNEKNLNTKNKNEDSLFIREIIEKYYPHLIQLNPQMSERKIGHPSLTDDILNIKGVNSFTRLSLLRSSTKRQTTDNNNNNQSKNTIESISEGLYETPWDIQTPWITKLMDIDCNDVEKQSKIMNEMVKATSLYAKSNSLFPISSNRNDEKIQKKDSVYSFTDNESDECELHEEKLKQELLVTIQPVLYLPSCHNSINTPKKSQFGQSIRKHLIQLCSRKGTSDISNSVRMFIQCTIDRTDLSPYTTMRLIRQYMSGLKNLIKQQKKERGLITVIEEERKNTPKNVFINLDSIMESVLTKAVVKPLTPYVYKLLVLEHYKNSNLKLISDGIEGARKLKPEKLGLKDSSVAIIESNLKMIDKKFLMMAKAYSPERKIGHLISVIEIVFQVVKLIYPITSSESAGNDIKTDNLLPVLAYIFSKCKKDAIAAQCEVEYIEGLMWSSNLVNGEPGFYLMNFMSSLEVIKVLARPQLNSHKLLDLTDKEPSKISNSSFFTRINHASISDTATGSINVIILDEKVNKLITKTFPVRSTVNARTLCNSISHRLGLFNPMDYNLYILNGKEDVLLGDFEFPLQIKQNYQHRTKETIQFIFKRKNAIFILPSSVSI